MEGPSRYLIGIDLGTTNCAVAYIDTRHGTSAPSPSGIRLFEIAQLTGPGEVRLAPSCRPFFTSQPKTRFPRAR